MKPTRFLTLRNIPAALISDAKRKGNAMNPRQTLRATIITLLRKWLKTKGDA